MLATSTDPASTRFTRSDAVRLIGASVLLVAAMSLILGLDFLPAQPSRAIDAEANLAFDLSTGPRRGRLYLVYTDELFEGGKSALNAGRYPGEGFDEAFLRWGSQELAEVASRQ